MNSGKLEGEWGQHQETFKTQSSRMFYWNSNVQSDMLECSEPFNWISHLLVSLKKKTYILLLPLSSYVSPAILPPSAHLKSRIETWVVASLKMSFLSLAAASALCRASSPASPLLFNNSSTWSGEIQLAALHSELTRSVVLAFTRTPLLGFSSLRFSWFRFLSCSSRFFSCSSRFLFALNSLSFSSLLLFCSASWNW